MISYCTISTIMLAIKIFLLKNSIAKWKEYKNILPALIRTYSNCFTKILSLRYFHMALKNIMCYNNSRNIILFKSINW